MSARILLGAVLAVACSAAAAAPSRTLVPPPGFTAAVQQGKAGDKCGDMPKPYTGKLEFPSKYEGSDKARDDRNPKAEKKYKQQTEPVTRMEKEISKLVGDYLRTGHPAILDCALGALAAWAEADAIRAETRDHTGKSVRKWALGSLASAYVRLKFSSSQPLKDRQQETAKIERWFAALGEQVIGEWSGQPLEKVNNHEYWAAWSVMATGVALNRRDFFDWAVKIYRTAAGQVDAQGFLPNELARDTRALMYHNYSLPPLAMIAAFAKANGVNLVGENDAALTRLARQTLAGLDQPAIFEQKTGEKQNLEELQENSKFAWLEAYCWTTACGGTMARRVASLRPLKTYRLGGDVTELFADTRRAESAPADTECAGDCTVAGPRLKPSDSLLSQGPSP